MVKQEEISFKNSKGQKLIGVLRMPAKKTDKAVIICHGFTGNKDEKHLVALADVLQKAGFAAFRFDFTGNGESEGEFYESKISQEVSDVTSAINLLKNKGFFKFAITGHSLGGIIAILSTKNFRFDCIAVFASGFDPAAIPKRFHWDKAKFVDGKAKSVFWDLTRTISKDFVRDFEGKNPELILKNLKIPILIVQGSTDRTVSVKTAKFIFNKTNSKTEKELVVIKGADHVFYHKEKELAEIVSAFLKVHL